MFSGIIQAQGEIASAAPTPSGRRLAVRAAGFWRDAPPGASIALDGVCLTLAARDADLAEFDVVGETLARTTLGGIRAGTRVNLERALRADARIDGHFVQGHVEGVADISRIERRAGEAKWWFRVPAELRRCLIPKGSIAVDGISLTLVDVAPDGFSVVLIPTTLSVTTLGTKRPGDRVNIETDIIARTVVHTLESWEVATWGGVRPPGGFVRPSQSQ